MGRLQKRRIQKGDSAIRQSDTYHEIFVISDEGNIERHWLSEDSIQERGFYWTPTNGNIYFEGYSNPIDKIEWEEEEVVDKGKVTGFIPSYEWKAFRNQKVAEEAFNYKKSLDLPWLYIMLGLAGLVCLLIIITQFMP